MPVECPSLLPIIDKALLPISMLSSVPSSLADTAAPILGSHGPPAIKLLLTSTFTFSEKGKLSGPIIGSVIVWSANATDAILHPIATAIPKANFLDFLKELLFDIIFPPLIILVVF